MILLCVNRGGLIDIVRTILCHTLLCTLIDVYIACVCHVLNMFLWIYNVARHAALQSNVLSNDFNIEFNVLV